VTDEQDISQELAYYNRERALKVIDSLKKHYMNGYYAADRKEALALAMDMIPPGAVVARGDSMSVDQIGLLSEIAKRNQNRLIDPFQTDEQGHWLEEPERLRMQRETYFADILIAGTNAITLDGKLVNVDGSGNRVSAIVFGPGKVILIVGANKIVQDVEAGLERIRHYAAPVNAKRHAMKNHNPNFGTLPCARTGVCIDCRSEWRICNYTVIIEGALPKHKGRINVILVGETLGI
jgi:L-lactate utilization protein LutB